MKRVSVMKVSDIPPGQCTAVEAGGIGIALCNVDGSIYAVDNTCPHAGGPLGEGHLDGPFIECPWHGWRYDVRSGTRPENPEIRVPCYAVEICDDLIHVLIPSD